MVQMSTDNPCLQAVKYRSLLLPEFEKTSDGWIIFKDKQYYVSTDKAPMENAREFCKKNFGDLAVIDGNTERKFLLSYVRHLFDIVDVSNSEK